jgi:hypothetical protein
MMHEATVMYFSNEFFPPNADNQSKIVMREKKKNASSNLTHLNRYNTPQSNELHTNFMLTNTAATISTLWDECLCSIAIRLLFFNTQKRVGTTVCKLRKIITDIRQG